jgi:hypothetical protein
MSDVNIQTFSGKVNVTDNFKVGTSHFFVDTQDNKVGLNTATPNSSLHVNGNAYVATDISFGGILSGNGSGLTSVNSDSGLWAGAGTGNVYLSTSTDNVGIGTDAPTEKIHLKDGSIRLDSTGTVSIINKHDTSDYGVLSLDAGYRGGSSRPKIRIVGYQGQGTVNDDNLITFHTNGSERMKINQSGNVGIGTSSPAHNLQISTPNTVASLSVMSEANDGYAQLKLGERGGVTDERYGFTIAYDGNDHLGHGNNTFHILRRDASTTPLPCLSIPRGTGNVGIGTTSPENTLHIESSSADLIYLHKTVNAGGVGIKFSDIGTSPNQFGYLRYYHQDTESFGTGNCFRLSTNQSEETLALGGCLHIGVDGKDDGYMINSAGAGRKNLFIQSTFGGNTSQNYGWWIGAQNQGLTTTDNDLYFGVARNGTTTVAAFIQDNLNNVQMNFTGQHRTFVKDIPTNQLEDKEGLIVVANQNEFVKMSGGVARGNEAITINESLPLVTLSTKSNDKKCFGVLSTTEDPETRKEVHGNFASLMHKEKGDTRVYVNSVGEGAIWVTNINGTLESGDYITTSNVVGYGMKQGDDILHNYTVAKILMDCDFNPPTKVKKVIKKELKIIDYWIRYGDVKITEEEYHTLSETKRKIVEGVHYRIDQMDVRVEDPEKASFVYEKREELVNVLDEHGQLQWEDTEDTEKAYKIRYLLPDGTQISEEEYTTRALADEKVYIAAFVGCTYHCG